MKDEGGPLGIGFQEQVPNQSELLAAVKSRGGERRIKSSWHDHEQVRVRKTNKREPSKTRRKLVRYRQNQGRFVPLRQVRQEPDYRADGGRR